jgi:uncharacterized coiled-coil DUF342 family protein
MNLPLRCICGYQSEIDRLKKERDELKLKVQELYTESERLSRELAK